MESLDSIAFFYYYKTMTKIKTKLTKLEKARVKLEIEIDAGEMKPFFEQAFTKVSPQVEIHGFRKGMAPKRLILEKIGQNRFAQEVLDLVLPQSFHQTVVENKLVTVAPPAVAIDDFKVELNGEPVTLKYTAEVDILPEIKIGDYKKLKIDKREFEFKPATGKDVEDIVTRLRKDAAVFEDKTGGAEIGDRAEINFEGKIKNVAQENLTSKNYPVILGDGILIPEFEKEIVGMKKGDKKKINVKIKDRKVDFEVEVLNLQKIILPPEDDELAKKFNQKSFADLKKEIEKSVNDGKKQQLKIRQENIVMEKMLIVSKVELSTSLIENELNRLIDSQRQNLMKQGITLENYLEKMKVTMEKLKEDLKPQAEKNIKYGLILGEVAKKMKLDLKDKDAGKLALEHLIKTIVK